MKSVFSKKIIKTIFLFGAANFALGFLYSDTTHIVAKGETLYSISKKYGSTVQSICDANKIDGADIKVGQKLIIPVVETATVPKKTSETTEKKSSTSIYTVKKGDTWYAISREYSIPVKDLYALNDTDGSSGLKVGQKIKVPQKTTQVASVPKTPTPTKTPDVSVPVIDVHNYSNKKGDSTLVWPVEKPDVTYVNGKVSGVSLSAKKDETVSAIKSGTVMFSGSYRGFGNVVFIQSKTGHIYAYTGLGKVTVSKGEYIDFKTQIGTAGIDSYSSKPQISLMVFQNGLPIDPAKAPRG